MNDGSTLRQAGLENSWVDASDDLVPGELAGLAMATRFEA